VFLGAGNLTVPCTGSAQLLYTLQLVDQLKTYRKPFIA